MTDGKHELLRRLFDRAMELPPPARAAFLDAECAKDPALRQRLAVMLAAVEGDRFLAEPTSDSSPAAVAATPPNATLREGPGTRIGPYKLLQQIGEGGFGVVFLAEQETPVVRKVALKVIKLGMDTNQVVARFEQERQALAMMDHPNIARVLDAGATETGRPYFVMELCKGAPIVEYCDENSLSIDERIELLAQVCHAVQHAHGKGIVHRDLKPSNILVGTQDGRPHAKVIDFGIAKATSQKLTDRTLFTEHQQVIGTFQYMSPEQAEGSLDIDTRTDVYSLGVLLYELLTGTTPFDKKTLQNAMFGEIQRMIREVEPPKPSTRLSSSHDTLAGIAARRRVEPKRLGGLVRGELDWIVMKALEKDRARRYETANSLAMDLRRHLAGDDVLAAPPSAGYRLRKLVRRHRGLVAALAAVTMTLVLGVVAFAWQAAVARDERDNARTAWQAEAEQRALVEEQRILAKARGDEFEKVAEFQAAMLEQLDPTAAGKKLFTDVMARYETALQKGQVPAEERAALVAAFRDQWSKVNATDTAKALLDEALLRPSVHAIEEQFAEYPGVAAKLQHRLASVYRDIGTFEAAVPLLQNALAIRRRDYGEEHSVTLSSLSDLGLALWNLGRQQEAEPIYREALEKCRRALGEDDPQTCTVRNNLAVLLSNVGRAAEAEPLAQQVLATRRRTLGDDHPETLTAMSNLALALEHLGRTAEAESLYRDALAQRRRVLGDDDPATLVTINNLGLLLKDRNELAEAETLLREAAETRRRVLGEDHPERLVPLNNLTLVLQAQGKFAAAETCSRDVLQARERLLGKDHPATLTARNNLATVLMSLERYADAEALLRDVVATQRRALGPRHPSTLSAVNNLGMALQNQQKLAEAEPLQREVLDGLLETAGPDHPNTIHSHTNLGSLLQKQGKTNEAESLFRSAMTNARRVLGAGHPTDLSATGSLARLLFAEGRFAEVVTIVEPVVVSFRKAEGERAAASLARVLVLLGRAKGRAAKVAAEFVAAEAVLVEAEGMLVGIPGQKPTDRGECVQALVDLCVAWDAVEPGKGHAERAAAWRAKLDGAK